MKIAILQDDFPPYHAGGAGTVAHGLAQGFLKKGHEVLVVTTVNKKEHAGEGEQAGMYVVRIYSSYNPRWQAYRSLYNPSTVTELESALQKFKPDVVHIHNVHYHLSYYALVIAKRHAQKVFLTAHDVMLFHYGKLTEFIDYSTTEIPKTFNYKISPLQQWKKYGLRYNLLRNFIIKRYLRYIDGIFAVSHALRDALIQNGIDVSAVVYNGVDQRNWTPTSEAVISFKKDNNIGDVPTVLFVGGTTGSKGWPQTLAAMELVLQRHPAALLLLVGRVGSQELPPSFVRKIGWLSGNDIAAVYAASTVVLQPSLCLETFGLTALEGMISAKPVIGTCFGGVPEVVEDTVTGYILNPLNTELFGKKIDELISDKTLAAQMGEAGKKRAVENFSLEFQVKNYEALFIHSLEKK